MRSRKRARARRQRRAAARKALCVFVSIVLVVGLMPGFVAWGEDESKAEFSEPSDVPTQGGLNDDGTDARSGSALTSNTETGSVDGSANDRLTSGVDPDDADGLANVSNQLEEKESLERADNNTDGNNAISEQGQAVYVERGEHDLVSMMTSQESNAGYPHTIALVSENWSTEWGPSGTYLAYVDGERARVDEGMGKNFGYLKPGESVVVSYDANNLGLSTVPWTLVDWEDVNQTIKSSGNISSGGTVTLTNNLNVTCIFGLSDPWAASGYPTQAFKFYYVEYHGKEITVDPNNGGSGQTFRRAVNGYLLLNDATLGSAPTRGGYVFRGWNTAADGSDTHYAHADDSKYAVESEGEVTLYAEWQRSFVFKGANGTNVTTDFAVTQNASDATDASNATPATAPANSSSALKSGWTNVSGWFEASTVDNTPVFTSGQTRSDIKNGDYVSAYADGTIPLYAMAKVTATLNAGAHASSSAADVTHYYNASGQYSPNASVTLTPGSGWEALGFTKASTNVTAADSGLAANSSGVVSVPYTALDADGENWYSLVRRPVKVTYDGNGATSGSAPSDSSGGYQVYNASGQFTKPSATLASSAGNLKKDGYKFAGWKIGNTVYSADDLSSGASYTWSSDGSDATVTAYAVWDLDLSVAPPAAKNLTYNGSAQALVTAGSANAGAVSYAMLYALGSDATTAPAEGYSNAVPSRTDAGPYYVWYEVVGADGVTVIDGPKCVEAEIKKAEITVTAEPKTITYGDAPANAGVVYSGFKGTDSDSVISGSPTYAYSYTQYGNVGKYDITPVVTGLSATNYTFKPAVGELAVEPLTVGLTWGSTALTYNGKDQAPTATATGLVSGDSCNVTVSGEQKHPGLSYTATAASLDNPNYKLPLIATTNFSIAKAPLTVTAKPKTITYGDAPANDGVTYSGFVNGETEDVLGGTLSYTYDYAQYGNVGNGYKIAPGGLTSADYDITFAEGALTVEQREVTLVWSSPVAFDYTGSPITWPLPAVGNTVNGDALTAKWATPTGTKDVATAADADTYTPKVDGLLGAKASNYKLPAAPATTGTWSINPPGTNAMSVTIAGWTYGKRSATANAPTVIADFGANTATFEYFTDAACKTPVDASNPRTPPTNAGGYYVKATIAGTTNYRGADAVAPFTVSKANITVTADDKGSKRGETKKALTYSVSGDFVAADRAGLDACVTLSESVDTQVTGSYTIAVSTAAHQNYNITPVNGTYTVTRALANVAAAGYAGAYDGKDVDSATNKPKAIEVTVSDPDTGKAFDGSSDPTVTVYYSDNKDFQTELGLSDDQVAALRGDDISTQSFKDAWDYLQGKLRAGSYAQTSPKYSGAGTRTVYFMVVSDQVSPDVIFGSKDVVINKAPLTITAKDKAVVYGDGPANDGVTYSGFVNGENEGTAARAGALSYAYGGYAAGSPAGKYAITPAGLTFSNYDVVYKPGTLTVGRRAVTVTAEPVEVTYGDAPAGNGVKCDGLQGSDTAASLGTPSYSFTYSQYGNVGAYQVTPAGLSSPNYAITYAPGTLTVKPRPLTLTWPTPDSFAYTGSELTYGAPALGGVVNGDDVSVGDYAGNKATTAGTHTAEVTSLAGAKSGNYALPANKSRDWTIVGAANRAAVTLEGWTYGDGPNEPAVEAAFGEDTADFSYAASEDGPFGAAVPTAAGTYWVKATIAASGNHDGAEATAKFTIAKRPATVAAKPQVVEVGGSVATGLGQVELTGAASGDALSAVVLTGSSTAAVAESGAITPSGAVLKDASGADVTANYDVTCKPGALLVAGVKAAENGKLIYAMAKDVWLTVDEAAKLLAASDAEAQMAKLADVRAQDTATGAALDVQVADRGGLAAVAGEYKVTFKVNPEVQVTFHVTGTVPDNGPSATKPGSARKAASPATGDAMPVALLAATALASACVLAFSWRRRESALPGKHARK